MEPFATQVLPDGTIYMKVTGNLDDKNFETLKAQIEDTKKLVKGEFEKQGKKPDILFDLTDFTGTYNVGAMLAFKGLEEHNRPFTNRTGIFGGSPAAQVAAELTLALIGRDNLKIFKERAEAEVWLKA